MTSQVSAPRVYGSWQRASSSPANGGINSRAGRITRAGRRAAAGQRSGGDRNRPAPPEKTWQRRGLMVLAGRPIWQTHRPPSQPLSDSPPIAGRALSHPPPPPPHSLGHIYPLSFALIISSSVFRALTLVLFLAAVLELVLHLFLALIGKLGLTPYLLVYRYIPFFPVLIFQCWRRVATALVIPFSPTCPLLWLKLF